MRTRTYRSRMWVFSYYSRSSQRILIWCSCGTKEEIFELSRATTNEQPLLILSGAPRSGNWTPFSIFSVGDERGSVINDYL